MSTAMTTLAPLPLTLTSSISTEKMKNEKRRAAEFVFEFLRSLIVGDQASDVDVEMRCDVPL